ncbi:hypothetical protein CLVI_21070 [Clostridium vincentii]|uniref:Uncharacterized protein n=2 Tax=Clostridium vincentii TaxID=52704 RepID=A0A2T0BDY6_9CLOT|nr:hypothetical protein CLVI_21070 [Clostridium vincentii]
MIDVIIVIVLILGIIISVVGLKKQNKSFKYIGFIFIILCLIYIVPQFLEGFINGALAPNIIRVFVP